MKTIWGSYESVVKYEENKISVQVHLSGQALGGLSQENMSENNKLSHRFCIAPMMDWTDRRCRAFHRLMSRRARLYTEMVTADAVVFGPRERLIGFDAGRASGRAPARRIGPAPARRGRADRRRFRLRRDQPQLRLPVRPGAERPLRRVPDARAGAGRRMRRGDGGRGRRSGHRQMPDRRRRRRSRAKLCSPSPLR